MKPAVNKLIILMFLIIMSDLLYAGGFSIDANRFKSTPFEDGYFSVYGAEGLDQDLFGAGFLMHYMPDSISQFNAEGDIIRSVIENQITADISFFYSPVKYFDFGLVFPVMIYQNGDGWDEEDSLPSGGIGDIRLVPRFQIANVSDGLFALSLIPEMTIPTGELVHSALGSSLFTFKPAIAIGSESKRVGFTTNLFYQILQKQYYAESVFDDEFGVKVALNLHAVPQLFDIVAEFHANTSIAEPFKNEAVDNIELGGGFKVKTPVDIDVSAGAYGGFGSAVGVPKFRVFLGISWSMDVSKKQVETPKPEVKPEVKEEPKPEVKPEAKPEVKPE
ncbi:MAG TPA: transporter, partial [bacterium]|nr:transporter [bacterium]